MVISKRGRVAVNAALIFASLLCVLPLVLLITASLTDDKAILRDGYSFLPRSFSLDAYSYLLSQAKMLGRGYLVTIFVTVFGTCLSLAITTLLAYPLSRKDLPGSKLFTFAVFFTILFNGGLVPTYLVYTQLIHIKNTIWALLVPGLLVKGFNVLIMRTFFVNSIPPAMLEAARIDGAGEFRIFFSVVLPLSGPILATIGLFSAIAYWNDWYNGLIYLTDPRLFSLQNILNRIMSDIQFLSMSDLGSQLSQKAAAIPTSTVRMAIAVVAVLPILAAYPFFQKYFVKGITVGGVKG